MINMGRQQEQDMSSQDTFQVAMEQVLNTGRKVFNCVSSIPIQLYLFVAYFTWILLTLPLRFLYPPAYWFIEGYLYKWILALVGCFVMQGGVTVVEEGEDVAALAKDRCLLMANHQDSLDVPLLMLAVQDKGDACCHLTWILDHMFRYTHFGLVCKNHGDIFVQSGKTARQSALEGLKKSLVDVFLPRQRRWLVLFPEGGFLRNMKQRSMQYAAKMGYPRLEHVALPYVGALETVLDTLIDSDKGHSLPNPGLKWIIDITIGYPGGRPINMIDCLLCRGSHQHVTLFYRVYDVTTVPRDTDSLTRWIQDRYVEKDAMLAEYARSGRFPATVSTTRHSTAASHSHMNGTTDRMKKTDNAWNSGRHLNVSWLYFMSLHCFFLFCLYAQYHVISYTLKTIGERFL